ncbi:MAG: hypothetical protein KKD56_09295 [Acidobacteria bacterium]|nr:hypothetical protein [Acidobacteriota bacterium]
MIESKAATRQARLYDALQIHSFEEMTDNRTCAQKMDLESGRSRGGEFNTRGLPGIHIYVIIIPVMENQEEKLREKLKSLRAEHRSLMRLLLRKDELAIGTVYKVNKRCGSPYCHCKKGPGHPHTFFMFSEKGKRRCKFVRQADVPRIRKAAERYKKCRDAIRRLKSIHLQEIKILTDLIAKRGIKYQ